MIMVSYNAILGILRQPFNDISTMTGSFKLIDCDGNESICHYSFHSVRCTYDTRYWAVEIMKDGRHSFGFNTIPQCYGVHNEADIVRDIQKGINGWLSAERCGFTIKYLDGYDIFNTKEDTMTNMTKTELEQKYCEAQRKIDEYERERDRFLKDIDKRDQSISDLIDANEKLTKENNKLSVDISKKNDEIDSLLYELDGVQIKLSNKTRDYETYKHLAENLNDENARLNTIKIELSKTAKELAKDVKFWKEKAYEMDKKNCEFRSRNRELEKELEKEKLRLVCKVEVTPETCYQIDILAREIDRLEKENKNCKGMLDTQHEHIKRVEEENVELSRINSVRLGDINRLRDKVDKIDGYLHSIDDAYSEMPVNKLRPGYYDGMVKFCNDVFDILDDWKKL